MIWFKQYISPELRGHIEQVPWFSRCDIKEQIDVPIQCRQVETLSEAKANWDDRYGWQNVLIDTLNQLSLYLHDHHRRKYQKWNKIAKEAERLREGVVYPMADRIGMNESLKITIRYVVGGYLLEEYYQANDCNPPRTYDKWLEVCKKGHFPCGWDGKWPDGTLLYI